MISRTNYLVGMSLALKAQPLGGPIIQSRLCTTRRFIAGFATLILLVFQPLVGRGQGALTNGARHLGEIVPAGDADSWTFSANAADSIFLRVGATNFNPRIRIFGPNNEPVGEVVSPRLDTRDVFLTAQATNSGTYTVLVSSTTAALTGTYALHLAQIPGTFVVSPGDEGGPLQNGASNPGTVSLGDLDMWSFSANAGDSLILRMGATDLNPWIRLYGPNGALVGEAISLRFDTRDLFLTHSATNSGVYTVVVSSTTGGFSGTYNLHLAQAPGTFVVSSGDEGGPLQNGANNPGTLAVGDLDMWSFTANVGDSLMLRMGTVDLNPWIRLYGPNGALVGEATSLRFDTRDVFLTHSATNSGVYTVVVSSTTGGFSGTYNLHLAQAPGTFLVSSGDEGGPLQNGANNPGTLAVGDLDMWSFTANAGDSLMLRMGTVDLNPWIRLYGPNGVLVGEATSLRFDTRDVFLTHSATNSGVYTVVVSSTTGGFSGTYNLHLAQAPETFVVSSGDEGGPLQNGANNPGTLAVGDLDMWSFTANVGDSLMLRIGTVDLNPWIRLYGPNGALVGEATSLRFDTRDVFLTRSATNSGVYTVVVSSTTGGFSGTYNLHLAQAPETFVVSSGDEGGALVNGATNSAVLNLGDLDVWSFVGTVGDSNVLRVTAVDFNPWIRLYDPTGELVAEAVSPRFDTRNVNLIHEITENPGIYTVVISSTTTGFSSAYTFKQSRWAPDLIVPDKPAIDEGATLNVSISAQDPDEPAKPLQFKLISAPLGVNLALDGATNAILSWATTEADGPSTNVIVASVSDVVNGRSFSRTNEFTVIVREINLPPQLTVPADQTTSELTPWNVSISATDADIPANPLTFSLVAPPAGLSINPATGAISWIPTESQGPATHVITVVVTDDSPSAANAQHLSTTNTFTVNVREVNVPPRPVVPSEQTVDELSSLNVTVGAADDDLPPNTFSFALVSPPLGMTINPNTGAISWSPTEAQGPSTNRITVVVTDNSPVAINSQQLSGTNTFNVIVREVNSAPQAVVPAEQTINELATLNVSVTATDSDLPANTSTFSLVSPPAGMTINAASGAITWTPTEAQGPSTNVITVVATDNSPLAVNSQQLTGTNSFTVIVREVNAAPQAAVPAEQTISELATLSVTVTATDSDLPADHSTFSLVAPPTGMTINAASGAITWTPTEAQGPSTNVITVVATDDGVPPLSGTNSFTVVVREVNVAPTLEPIPDRSALNGALFSLPIVAADADLPANSLTFSLEAPPQGMTIDAAKGLVSWTPTQAQVGAHTLTVRVTDNGSPALSATATFQVTVTGQELRLAIQPLVGGLMQIRITGDLNLTYELQVSADLLNWERLLEFRLATSPFNHIDGDSATKPLRFYRLLLPSNP